MGSSQWFIDIDPFQRCKFWEATYHALIKPMLEYASAVLATDVNRIEQVQRQGACFVQRNYWEREPGCVSRMIKELGRQSLEERRLIHRLTLLYQIQLGLIDINARPILCSNNRCTIGAHRIYQPLATQPVYKYSFYPRTIRDWNRLPATATVNQTLEEFVAAIQIPSATITFVTP